MCITKVQAWSFDGKTYASEGLAIRAAVGKAVSNEALAQIVIDNSSTLIPLLQRIVEIEEEKHPEVASEDRHNSQWRQTR